jgi:hypothetical protein
MSVCPSAFDIVSAPKQMEKSFFFNLTLEIFTEICQATSLFIHTGSQQNLLHLGS